MRTIEDVYSRSVLRHAEAVATYPVDGEDNDMGQDESAPDVWWITSSNGIDVYRLQVVGGSEEFGDGIPFVSCNCPNGQQLGGHPRCWHSAAVLLVLRDPERYGRVPAEP